MSLSISERMQIIYIRLKNCYQVEIIIQCTRSVSVVKMDIDEFEYALERTGLCYYRCLISSRFMFTIFKVTENSMLYF